MHHQSMLALGLLPQLIAGYSIAQRRGVDCSYSTDAAGGETCRSFAEPYGTSVEEFENLNPGVNCANMAAGNYCLIGTVTDDKPTTTSSSTVVSSTTSLAPNTPTQSGLAKDCDRFHKVKSGEQCSLIEAAYGISQEQFAKWNPSINAECTNLLLDYYVCVHVLGAKQPTTTKTTTSPPEQTCYPDPPDPVQPGAICGCDRWHEVKDESTTCEGIINYENINADDFYRWNPKIGGRACTGLWKGYNVCVHGPGATKPTTTSKPTPTCHLNAPKPVQPGATCKCDGWHQVKDEKTTCDAIIKYEKIYADDFYKWNPKVGGKSCNGLWKGYWACTHVPGAKRPPTEPQCHPNAPKPVQPGSDCHCKKWHLVKNEKTTCDAIIKYEHIKASDFYRWNPKVGGKACNGLWKGYNVCVGV